MLVHSHGDVHGRPGLLLLLLLPEYTQKQRTPLYITDELLQRIEHVEVEVKVGEAELASTTNSAV
jgi:hypothetical protein